MATSTMMKKLSMATVGAALMALGVGAAAQAASLVGDMINYEHKYGNTTYVKLTPIVSTDTSDVVDYYGVYQINPDATSFLINGFGAGYWVRGSFNGFRLSDLNFDSGSPITGIDFETNMQGLDASRISFTGDSVSVDWNSLSYNSDTYLKINLKTIPENLKAVPEPASTLGLLALGTLGAGSMLKRKQQQKATVKA